MRRFLIGPAGLACAAILACSGGKGGGGLVSPPPGPVATFQCDDSAAATDQVVLRCGAQVAADVWRIDVVIGVPTTSTDINGFVFDVVYDPLLLAYVPGSARAGTLLISDGGTQLFAAALEPGHPGDLAVGINRPWAARGCGTGGAGRPVPAGRANGGRVRRRSGPTGPAPRRGAGECTGRRRRRRPAAGGKSGTPRPPGRRSGVAGPDHRGGNASGRSDPVAPRRPGGATSGEHRHDRRPGGIAGQGGGRAAAPSLRPGTSAFRGRFGG